MAWKSSTCGSHLIWIKQPSHDAKNCRLPCTWRSYDTNCFTMAYLFHSTNPHNKSSKISHKHTHGSMTRGGLEILLQGKRLQLRETVMDPLITKPPIKLALSNCKQWNWWCQEVSSFWTQFTPPYPNCGS
jgi:hypothetical protein